MENRSTRKNESIKTTTYVLFIIGVSIVLSTIIILVANDVLAFTKDSREVDIYITENASNLAIANILKENDVIKYNHLFSMFMGMMKVKKGDIKEGQYTINAGYDYRAIINSLKSSANRRDTVRITIPEGYTTEQIVDTLSEQKVCSAEKLWEAIKNYEFKCDYIKDINNDEHRLEGYLYPDTYDFYINDTAENAIVRFLNNFELKFTDEMKERADELGYSVHEIITIASLIEREAKLADEQATIAGVIYNRLKSKNYKYLQIDASVQYALGHKEKLTFNDLKVNSPYNTYLVEGLPIGPIANPGISAILAALYPENHSYYYYVAKSDGSHIFSKTLAEHNRAKESVK